MELMAATVVIPRDASPLVHCAVIEGVAVTETRYLTLVKCWMGVEELQAVHKQDHRKRDIDEACRADQRRAPID
jgi:hypothetical protein